LLEAAIDLAKDKMRDPSVDGDCPPGETCQGKLCEPNAVGP